MCCFFFFKQKPADDMRISDWSSDVCSSDLPQLEGIDLLRAVGIGGQRLLGVETAALEPAVVRDIAHDVGAKFLVERYAPGGFGLSIGRRRDRAAETSLAHIMRGRDAIDQIRFQHPPGPWPVPMRPACSGVQPPFVKKASRKSDVEGKR